MAAAAKVMTPVFRVSFPHLDEPHAMEAKNTPKFSVGAIWDPATFTEADKAKWAAMGKLIDDASLLVHKKKATDLPKNYKQAIRDGEEKGDLEGYGADKKFANLSSQMRPGVIDRDGLPIPVADLKETIFPGCYARATVTSYAYNKGGGLGVALGLQNLQFVRKGARIDSRSDASEDFQNDALDDDDRDPLG